MGHLLMSSEPYAPDVCGRGMHMEEKTSLHGHIRVPSFHSTPDEHRQAPYGSSTNLRWSDDPCYQSWRLVSDDRPFSRGNTHQYTNSRDWRSASDSTRAHNQRYGTPQATGKLYDADSARQDIGRGFMYPGEWDEPPWRDMQTVPPQDGQHRSKGVSQQVPADQVGKGDPREQH